MPAPVATVRGNPAGLKLRDGYQAFITFSLNPTIALWEKVVKPPGNDGGDPIDQTTMHNILIRTKSPRYLSEITDTTSTVAYDPAAWDDIHSIINVPQTITVTFSDGSTLAFFGYLKSFEPGDMSDGEQPEATITIVATNIDPLSCEEYLPVMTPGAGSCVP